MATEETKPVEREAFDEFWVTIKNVPVNRRLVAQEAAKAGWDAALERAAQVVQGNIVNFETFIPTLRGDPIARERAQVVLNILIGERDAIRALKGSR